MPPFLGPTSRSAAAAAASSPGVVAHAIGDFEAATRKAAGALEAIYTMPLLAHAAMEPANCTVHVRKDGCDLWLGTQVISSARERPLRR